MKRKISSLSEVNSIAAYLRRIGAKPRSIRTAVVEEKRGRYWKDLAIIRFSRDGKVICRDPAFEPTKIESDAIEAEVTTEVEFPNHVAIEALRGPDIPGPIREATKDNVFEFRNVEGKIVMVQVRVQRPDGKSYIPYSFWDDGKWRAIEPEGPLPLFGVEALPEHSVVFIHEGAKAAAAVRNMVAARDPAQASQLANHPWGAELANAAHLGWVGGALSPSRTDWSVLAAQGIKRAYIVADNDVPGVTAVPEIAKELRMPVFAINFNTEFPPSFDLADPFPDTLFRDTDGVRHYVGPSFRDCLRPATWATDLIPGVAKPGKPPGRPTPVLRDCIKSQWAYVPDIDMFVNKELPELRYNEQVFNKIMGPFSHVAELSRLITKTFTGYHMRLCYKPDKAGLRVVTYDGAHAINTFLESDYKPRAGDVTPWLDYLAYMFPIPEECHQVTRWLATLLAQPETRMAYGLLLVSEKQGIGKTTLGEAILRPLLRAQNVSFPTDTEITSDFNDWIAFKRLVFINEIYQGASWSTYHKLKSKVTDQHVHVNRKYERQYSIENWAHVIACSNSLRALKMEHEDRRWFYPKMAEKGWSRKQFAEFRAWLAGGGLNHIMYWAKQFNEYVLPGERAPETAKKKELIEISRSEGQVEAAHIAEALVNYPDPAMICMKDIVSKVRASAQSRIFDSDAELRRVMVHIEGCHVWPDRIKIFGIMQHAVINDLMKEMIAGAAPEEANAAMRKHMIRMAQLFEEPM